MLPQEILDALRPLWDRSRAVVATWLAEYCIQFWLSMYTFAKPADFELPRQKVHTKVGRTVGGMVLNSSETSGSLSNGRTLKTYS